MKQIKQHINNHPVIFSILILLLAILCTEVSKEHGQIWYYSIGAATQFGFALALFFLLKFLGILDTAGINAPRRLKPLLLVCPLFILCYLNAADFSTGELYITASVGMWALFIIHYISVGVFEELLCRSTILNVMLRKWGSTRKGIYKAVLLSSLLFGLAHLTNLVYGRADLISVLSQIVYATFFGVFFAACMIRNRSVLPIIIIHAFIDICGSLDDISNKSTFGVVNHISLEGAFFNILILLPLFLYGLFLLKKVYPMDSAIYSNHAQTQNLDT